MGNAYPGLITKNLKRDVSLIFRDWYPHGINLFWGEESVLRFNCCNNKRVWFLRHHREDTGYCDYKPTHYYLAVQKSKLKHVNFII